jgi:hypothetical protein
MNQELAEKIVCSRFRIKDTQMVSKQRIIQALAAYISAHSVLVEDLFIADPYHPRFNDWPEARLAPLRIMRLEHISGKLPDSQNFEQTKK